MSCITVLQDVVNNTRGVDLHNLERLILLAIEIAREGREGRKVGTIFTIGDIEAVLEQSTCLILDPLYHHADSVKHINNSDMRETVKELAQLDGGFVVSDDGVVVSACRYFNVASARMQMPLGLGSRHMAAASITHQTSTVAVVVSESSIVLVFDDGEIVAEIVPWVLKHYASHINGFYSQRSDEGITVISKQA